MCEEFNIDRSKCTLLTTDNANNMKAASRDFLGNGNHIPCFAHMINLLVDDTVKEISSFTNILDKVKRIVMHFKHSTSLMDQLRKAQADEGIPEGCVKILQQNVDTRWNSWFICLNNR